MKKRGQISVFIILAVLIIISIAIALYIKTSNDKTNLKREDFINSGLTPSITNIQNFAIDCLEETSKEAIDTIGIQGGYHQKPDQHYDLEFAFIPYYYHLGELLKPTNQEIQEQLSSYIDTNIENCIDQIKFPDFRLKYENPKTKSKINPSKVTFTTTLPISITNEQTSLFRLSSHPYTINSSLFEILEIADYITESHKDNEDFICINCLTELAKERNLYVDHISFEEDSTLVMILENKTQPEPYIFQFLNKYNLGEAP